MGSLGRHDNLIRIIEHEMKSRGYYNGRKNVEYEVKKRKNKVVAGEIDYYIRRGKYIILFEMKCCHSYKNRKKARDQLNRAEKYYFKPYHKVFKMYVTYKGPKSNNYKINWLK